MTEQAAEARERRILGTELLWAFGVGVLIAAVLGVIVFTALTADINPPSNVERIDPKTLHLSGEFAEQNLGTTVGADGGVTVRVIATQFMFVPRCIAVPYGRRVTLRFALRDIVAGWWTICASPSAPSAVRRCWSPQPFWRPRSESARMLRSSASSRQSS